MEGHAIEGVESLYQKYAVDSPRHISTDQLASLEEHWHAHPQWPKDKQGKGQVPKMPQSKAWAVYTDTCYSLKTVKAALAQLHGAHFFTLFRENPVAFTAIQQDFPELCRKKLAEEFDCAYRSDLHAFSVQQPGIIQTIKAIGKDGGKSTTFSTPKVDDPTVLAEMQKKYPPEAFFAKRVAQERRYLTAFYGSDEAKKKLRGGQVALKKISSSSKVVDRMPSIITDITNLLSGQSSQKRPDNFIS